MRKERFKVVCCKDSKNIEVPFGWSDDKELIDIMVKSINLHPSWHSPRVIDREIKTDGQKLVEFCDRMMGVE